MKKKCPNAFRKKAKALKTSKQCRISMAKLNKRAEEVKKLIHEIRSDPVAMKELRELDF